MENLHLKNIIQKPHGLFILKKLNDPDYCDTGYIPEELIQEIDVYINSLTIKNKEVKKFMMHYLGDLKHGNIKWELDITKQIITLFAKYKLNKLDINSYFDFKKANKEIYKIESFKKIQTNILTLEYKIDYNTKFVLGIYTNNEKSNKISKIYHYKTHY
jgi:hypothetical protein